MFNIHNNINSSEMQGLELAYSMTVRAIKRTYTLHIEHIAEQIGGLFVGAVVYAIVSLLMK